MFLRWHKIYYCVAKISHEQFMIMYFKILAFVFSLSNFNILLFQQQLAVNISNNIGRNAKIAWMRKTLLHHDSSSLLSSENYVCILNGYNNHQVSSNILIHVCWISGRNLMQLSLVTLQICPIHCKTFLWNFGFQESFLSKMGNSIRFSHFNWIGKHRDKEWIESVCIKRT